MSTDPVCPARNKECHGCGAKGHFKIKCPKTNKRQLPDKTEPPPKKVRMIDVSVDDSDNKNEVKPNFMFMVQPKHSSATGEREAKVSVKINGIKITAVIDSGCPVTIVNANTYAYLIGNGLQERGFTKGCSVPFLGYETNRPAIEISGSVMVEVTYEDVSVNERIYVAPYGRENLLGKLTAEALGVLIVGPNVYNVAKLKPFPKMKNCSVKISIDRSVSPKIVPYRRMPLAIEDKIHEEIHRLEELDIIEKVPTDEITWVSRMIAITKGDGTYRLVVDMREPNRAVRREYYPQPTIEETLLLPKVAKLSKIDLKKGFHLCELHPTCRHITGFATKDGVYRFKRLMFGLKSAPELFNREIDKILANHRGLRKYCDDFLVFGVDQADHDKNLQAVLKTIKEKGLEINEEKSIYDVTECAFLGHIVSTKGVFPDPGKVKAIKSMRAPQNKEELQTLLGM